jgi:hypothetical protein
VENTPKTAGFDIDRQLLLGVVAGVLIGYAIASSLSTVRAIRAGPQLVTVPAGPCPECAERAAAAAVSDARGE